VLGHEIRELLVIGSGGPDGSNSFRADHLYGAVIL